MSKIVSVDLSKLRPKCRTSKYDTFQVFGKIPKNPTSLEDSLVRGKFPKLVKGDYHYGRTHLYKSSLKLED